jgi:hypothetical protein
MYRKCVGEGCYSQEALHGLQAANHSEVESILKSTEDYYATCNEQAYVAAPGIAFVDVRHRFGREGAEWQAWTVMIEHMGVLYIYHRQANNIFQAEDKHSNRTICRTVCQDVYMYDPTSM